MATAAASSRASDDTVARNDARMLGPPTSVAERQVAMVWHKGLGAFATRKSQSHVRSQSVRRVVAVATRKALICVRIAVGLHKAKSHCTCHRVLGCVGCTHDVCQAASMARLARPTDAGLVAAMRTYRPRTPSMLLLEP